MLLPKDGGINVRSFNDEYLVGTKESHQLLGAPPTIDAALTHARNFSQSSLHPLAASIIEAQTPPSFLETDPHLQKSIRQLKNGALVVCAGQQPGLFGGPLLSLYKAATAISLARELQAKGLQVVPMFWNASEDHDFNEANRIAIPNHEFGQEPLIARLPNKKHDKSLSQIRISQDDLTYVQNLIDKHHLDESFLPKLNEDWGTWNTRIIYALSKGSGLIVCEPHWFAEQLVPIRQLVIDQQKDLLDLIKHQSQDLIEAGFANPVTVDDKDSMLFIDHENARVKLKITTGGDYSWRSHSTTAAQLATIIANEPQRFSSSVFSRPICQQYLFPVVIQVAGPTELNYLTQMRKTYASFSVTPPMLWPRAKFLLLEEQAKELIDKLGITEADVVQGKYPDPIIEEDPIGVNLERFIDENFRELDKTPDPDQKKIRVQFRRQLIKDLKQFKKESKQRGKERTKPVTKMVHQLKQLADPRGVPQERTMGAISLGFCANSRLLRLVEAAIDPNSTSMKIVWYTESDLK